jgi:glycosyltransferase involved in cell wall biosynthesis
VATEDGSGSIPAAAGHIDAWCWSTTHIAVKRAVARDKPIAVIAEYALLAKCLEDLLARVLKVDTVEAFFRNQDRFLGRPSGAAGLYPASEKSLQPSRPAHRHPGTTPGRFGKPSRKVASRFLHLQPASCVPADPPRTILYVGSSNPFNVHGLRQFVEHAWPSIVRRVPHARLRVVGPLPPLPGTPDPRIVHVGLLVGEPLQREYQAANVVINPQVAGTGLKIKCVEALSAGCPLVTNAAGADGLEDEAGRAYLLATDWPDFADHVVTLLSDAKVRLSLEANAKAFADRVFSPNAAFAEFAGALAARRPYSPVTVATGGSKCSSSRLASRLHELEPSLAAPFGSH